jgi:hypothetical protein
MYVTNIQNVYNPFTSVYNPFTRRGQPVTRHLWIITNSTSLEECLADNEMSIRRRRNDYTPP